MDHFRHISMDDPLLAAAGEQTSAWLAQRGWTVNAALSSVLMRAVQTSAGQYPHARGTRPVFEVPYIREHGYGKDNEALPIMEQREKLGEEIGNQVNNVFTLDQASRESSGEWSK